MIASLDKMIGSKVRELRDKSSIVQSDAARMCDLTLGEYQDGEIGARRFSAQELFKLCSKCNASLSDIFDGLRHAI